MTSPRVFRFAPPLAHQAFRGKSSIFRIVERSFPNAAQIIFLFGVPLIYLATPPKSAPQLLDHAETMHSTCILHLHESSLKQLLLFIPHGALVHCSFLCVCKRNWVYNMLKYTAACSESGVKMRYRCHTLEMC